MRMAASWSDPMGSPNTRLRRDDRAPDGELPSDRHPSFSDPNRKNANDRLTQKTPYKLAPPPTRPDTVFLVEPFALAINLEAGAVDQKVQWLRMIDPLWQDRQTAAATAKRRMIRDGNMDPEHIGETLLHGQRQ
jgi:hypothetical protein